MDSPPPSTALRSGLRPGRVRASMWPAFRHCSMHQRRPWAVMLPSVMPLACSICEMAPTVPDEPSASRQFALENSCKASSRSEEHTSELQSLTNLVCRLLLEKTKTVLTLLPPSRHYT